jgi:hypothetical protein
MESETNACADAITHESDNKQVLPKVKLTDIPITDENVALNVVISFLHLAQRRGAFQFDESAKILECVRFFTERK